MKYLFLDSTPLGLLLQGRYAEADECRAWLAAHLRAGVRVIVPEIIDYEVRRELLRLNKDRAIAQLDEFLAAEPDRCLPINSGALRRAAEIWAGVRAQGYPTADPHALDIDVILAAQVQTSRLAVSDLVVATSNVGHLGRLMPCQPWRAIASS